jgi:hypothetical protein
MKYVKGTQTYSIEDDGGLPIQKIRLVNETGDGEGVWVRQAPTEVVLMNNSLATFPFPSWGLVLPSKNPPGDRREEIKAPKREAGTQLVLHPMAWDQYLKTGIIDEDGNLIPPKVNPSDN